jgi:hypothetical protein
MLRQLRDQRHADQTGQEIMFIGDSDDVAASIADNTLGLLQFPTARAIAPAPAPGAATAAVELTATNVQPVCIELYSGLLTSRLATQITKARRGGGLLLSEMVAC